MMRFFRIHRLQYDLRGPKRAQNFVVLDVRTLIILKSFKGEAAGFCSKRIPHPTVRSTAQPTS